jgi:hypothetical protein
LLKSSEATLPKVGTDRAVSCETTKARYNIPRGELRANALRARLSAPLNYSRSIEQLDCSHFSPEFLSSQNLLSHSGGPWLPASLHPVRKLECGIRHLLWKRETSLFHLSHPLVNICRTPTRDVNHVVVVRLNDVAGMVRNEVEIFSN